MSTGLESLSPAKRKLLEAFRSTACVPQLFERQVEKIPGAPACRGVDGSSLSYAELNTRANQLAHSLRGKGIEPEARVGLYLERSPDFLVGLMGIFKAGGVYVPVDPNYPAAYVGQIVDDAKPALVLTSRSLREHLGDHLPAHVDVLCLDEFFAPNNAQGALSQSSTNPATCLRPEHLAYISYTSGSTGQPKGVMVEHRQILNWLYALWARMPFEAGEMVAQKTTPVFVVSLKEMLAGLLAGVPEVILPDAVVKDAPAMIEALKRHRVTRLNLVPSHLQSLIENLGTHTGTEALRSLRYCITAGEPLTQSLRAEVNAKLPWVQLWNNFGCTELNDVTYCAPDEQDAASLFVPIGRPIPNTKVYVLDAALRPVPIGMAGELCVESIGIARGYWGRPELTQERFVASPFSETPGVRLYKTGDLVRLLDNGTLEYLGREDFEIKIRGHRIDVRQVEQALREHPGIKETVVHRYARGEESAQLVAYHVAAPGRDTPTATDLKDYLAERLPSYMVPSFCVALDALPKLPNGKLDRMSLPAPDLSDLSAANYVAPRNETEQMLVDVWSLTLGIPAHRIGINDDFFELGGHSLSMVTLFSHVKQRLNVSLQTDSIFSHPTIAKQALIITSQSIPDKGRVDLREELALDPAIVPGAPLPSQPTASRAVFLTGVTGFLGAHLARSLLDKTAAQLFCLVRANSVLEAHARIRKNLQALQLWDDQLGHRITPVLGDLAQPRLGMTPQQFSRLGEQVDAIYHCGATVNFIYTYSALKAANVLGTQEMVRLACEGQLKPVHHVSTIGTYFGYPLEKSIAHGDDPLAHRPDASNGYIQSKWVAEGLIAAARGRGVPIGIYRPGLVGGARATGIVPDHDLVWSFVKGCIQIGLIPDLPDSMTFDMAPADEIADTIVALSLQRESLGRGFQLINRHPMPMSRLLNRVRAMGYPVDRVSYARWVQVLHDGAQRGVGNALDPHMASFPLPPSDGAQKPSGYAASRGHDFTQSALDSPALADEVLDRYLAHLLGIGYLPSPDRSHAAR